ncbi:pyruvate kinase [Gaopeijia maritima]|uniref:Pyruvate kinase n=1 Tax=Gaopeijia maritima TaxID=3119007 RepID=A0ABU9E7K7_9BACT
MLRTKIVCTIGPATSSPEVVEGLVRGGLDMARINMSHGSHEHHREAVERIRAAARKAGRPVPILVDLSGPKIRVGALAQPIELVEGERVVFAPEGQAAEGEIPTGYAGLAGDVGPGQQVLLDDGHLEIRCVETDGVRATFEVVRGGLLKSRKGINLPEVDVSVPSLTEKDLEDLEFALDIGAEYISLSFVRRASDMADLRSRVQGRALLVAKIEKAQALREIRGILAESDAVMVARGDLGVELPFERVPLAQKRIIQMANYYGRPVITATQMLESMIDSPRPTRAEASDVANAILDGTDAVMLSGETAVGSYPLQAVEALRRIAGEIEGSGVLEYGPRYVTAIDDDDPRAGASAREHAVAAATVDAARQLRAPALITITRSGFSARLVSSYRPSAPIFAVCTDPITFTQMAAVWGVRPLLATEEEVSYEALTEFGRRAVIDSGVGRVGQAIVVTAGYPFHTSGSTNTMRVEQL